MPEIVLDGLTGIIASLEVQEISDALEKLANDSVLRGQMGAAARKFTLAHFGVERLVNDHEEIYRQLLRQ